MILCDFHVHSNFSDGKLSIPEIVDFYGALGFGAIAITDHLCEQQTVLGHAARMIGHSLTSGSFPVYQAILKSEARRAWQQYRMVLLPGMELTKNTISNHRSAHILALGVTEWMTADKDARVLALEIRERGGLSIAAHPVSTRKIEKQTYHLWNRREELASCFDAWEVASGPYLFDEVLESDLPVIANSDLHRPEQIRAWKTVLHCERDRDAIFDAIRSQKLGIVFFDPEKGGITHGYHPSLDGLVGAAAMGLERSDLCLWDPRKLQALSKAEKV